MTERQRYQLARRLARDRYGKAGVAWTTHAYIEGDEGIRHIGYRNAHSRIAVAVGLDWQHCIDDFRRITGEVVS